MGFCGPRPISLHLAGGALLATIKQYVEQHRQRASSSPQSARLPRAEKLVSRLRSLCLDLGFLDYLPPHLDLEFDLLGELLRGTADRLEAERRQALLHIRLCDAIYDLATEQRDDTSRRSGRNKNSKPTVSFDIRVAGFRHGRDVERSL
jgi:hypothetical protein